MGYAWRNYPRRLEIKVKRAKVFAIVSLLRLTRERIPSRDQSYCRMESHNPQKHQSNASIQNYQQPSQQKQPLDIQQQRQAEQNLPLECTEEIAIQHPEQNSNPCLDNERKRHTGFPLSLLIQTITPHLDESNVMPLQLHYTMLKRHTQPSSVTMSSGAGINVDMSSKKRSIGQREPLEALHNHCLSPPWPITSSRHIKSIEP